jgi:hypothetical protein
MVKRIKKKSKPKPQSHHGSTKLDGLKFVGFFRRSGAIHEGKGEAAVVIDERATESQRGGAAAHPHRPGYRAWGNGLLRPDRNSHDLLLTPSPNLSVA